MTGRHVVGVAPSRSQPGLDLRETQGLWQPDAPYLNTATYGLPPRPTLEALEAVLDEWRSGQGLWEHWSESIERAREAFGRLTGARASGVAIGPSVSALIGLVAATLPPGARVVAPDVDFTSLLFPFLAHADRGVEVETVPLERLAEAVDERTTVVAASVVQSANGALLDWEAVAVRAERAGALLVLDATQACGWLPVDAGRADFIATAAYKWLMCPRGTAFMTVRPERLETIRPLAANWWAGDDPFGTYYGPPLRLASEARRLDTSPAWFSWVGAAPSLELIEQIGLDAIHDHDVALANRFREGLGLPPGNSAIVTADVPDAEERLARAGIRVSVRAGRVRASFHVYNSEGDVDAALAALKL